jgi:hypothetical protein
VEDAQYAEGGEGQVVERGALAGDAGGCHDVADVGEDRVIEEALGSLFGSGNGGRRWGGLRGGFGTV